MVAAGALEEVVARSLVAARVRRAVGPGETVAEPAQRVAAPVQRLVARAPVMAVARRRMMAPGEAALAAAVRRAGPWVMGCCSPGSGSYARRSVAGAFAAEGWRGPCHVGGEARPDPIRESMTLYSLHECPEGTTSPSHCRCQANSYW